MENGSRQKAQEEQQKCLKPEKKFFTVMFQIKVTFYCQQ